MKTVIRIILALGALILFVSCDTPEPAAYTVNMAVLPGPSALGALWLMDEAEKGNTENIYNIQILGSPDEIPPRLVQGTIDIAAVPTNMASVLFNATGEITVLGVSTKGVLHLVDATGEIASVADLRGKTIHLSGKGATPEFVLNYVLRENGLEPDIDVFLEFHTEQPQIAAMLSAGTAQIALLPEPFATTVLMQNENLNHALDLTEEWNLVQPDYGLVMTAIIVRNSFLEAHPAAVEIFMNEFAKSIDFVNTFLYEAAQKAVDFGVIPNVSIAEQAIPRSNQVFITGAHARQELEGYLRVLYNELPASIGGAMPDENFYFKN